MGVVKERELGANFLSEGEVKNFCANNLVIMCLRYSSIFEELTKGPNKKTVMGEVGDSESLISWYFLVRASLRYCTKYKMFPAQKIAHDKVVTQCNRCFSTSTNFLHIRA